MDGPLPGIKVTEVCDTAKTQFEELLNGVNGPKDLVIQKELMSLLEHVTPMKVLKRLASEDDQDDPVFSAVLSKSRPNRNYSKTCQAFSIAYALRAQSF